MAEKHLKGQQLKTLELQGLYGASSRGKSAVINAFRRWFLSQAVQEKLLRDSGAQYIRLEFRKPVRMLGKIRFQNDSIGINPWKK